jgi:DNA-binding IscR family transcriptional regulator
VGLSWQPGPLLPGAIGRFLVPEPLPKRLLWAEPLRRRRAEDFGGNREKAPDQPVVVRKILKLLEREGLVAFRQGRHGGVGLRHPASGITLGQIYKAVESESGVFAMRSQVHDRCVVACAMKRRLGPIFNAANDAVEQALSKTSLVELVRGVG